MKQPTPAPVSADQAAKDYANNNKATLDGELNEDGINNVISDFLAGAEWQAKQLQSPKQSAGVWVCASERQSTHYEDKCCRLSELSSPFWFTAYYDNSTKMYCYGSKKLPLTEVEWLDESQQLQSQQQPIDKNFEKITGFKTPAELAAYEKGQQDQEITYMEFIKAWDGYTNSHFGQAMKDTFDRLQSQQQSNIAMQGDYSKDEVYPLPPLQQEDKLGDKVVPFTIKEVEKWITDRMGYVPANWYIRNVVKLIQQYNEDFIQPQKDKPVWTDEQIEQIAEKLYPTPSAPFDKNNFKERIGFIKGLKYGCSEDKIGKAIDFVDRKINEYQEEINAGWQGHDLDLLNVQKLAWEEMKQFLQSL